MHYPNLLKRVVPFALALILGLSVAGIFVSLTPSFNFRGRSSYRQMKEEKRALEMEVERLKSRVEELKNSSDCGGAEYKRFKLYKEGEVDIPKARSKNKRNSDGTGTGYGEGYALPPKAVER